MGHWLTTLALVVFFYGLPALGAERLLTILSRVPPESIPACNRTNVVSCHRVEVNFEAIEAEETLEFPEGHILAKSSHTSTTDSKSYIFEKDDETFATLSIRDGHLQAKLYYPDKFLISIINCNGTCHVLVRSRLNRPAVRTNPPSMENPQDTSLPFNLDRATAQATSRKKESEAFVISLGFYYTPEYAAAVSDVTLAITNELAELSMVMSKNDLDIQFSVMCVSEMALDEDSDANTRVMDLQTSFDTWSQLFKSADMVVGLYGTPSSDAECGSIRGGVSPLERGYLPIIFVAHDCDDYALAQELGHAFGARRDHAYLVPDTDYITLMAAASEPGKKRIPHFSTPLREHRYRGFAIGTADSADNLAAVLANYGLYNALGDETTLTCTGDPCQDAPFVSCDGVYFGGACSGGVNFLCGRSCNQCWACQPATDADETLCAVLAYYGQCAEFPVQFFCTRSCGVCSAK